MNIREALEEARRFEDVEKILVSIIGKPDYDFPVNAYITNDNVTVWRVNGDNVRKQAELMYNLIRRNDVQKVEDRELADLYSYVDSELDILLHNYANSLSHRVEPNIDMEKIRSYSVLNYIICECQQTPLESISDEIHIPEGWKRID